MLCIKCGKGLSYEDIGLHKKLINRGSTEYYCKQCLAQEFKCSVSLLNKKIKQFKEQGCTLFIKE